MTPDDLRKIAEAATSGPWTVEQEVEETDFGKFEIFSVDPVTAFSWNADDTPAHTALDPLEEADAEFIATFNPKRVLELLDENERLTQRVKRLSHHERRNAKQRDECRDRLAAVEKLHPNIHGECHTCSNENGPLNWPCDTIKAARGE